MVEFMKMFFSIFAMEAFASFQFHTVANKMNEIHRNKMIEKIKKEILFNQNINRKIILT